MRTVDFTPLYRSIVGFDRLADMMDSATKIESQGYPPYNIEQVADNRLRITLAVAGFTDDEAIDWMLAPDDTIGVAPIEALRAGRKSEVRRVAQTLA